MAGRTPSEAIRAFTSPIQAALTCFADGRVSVDQYTTGAVGVLTFNRSADVLLNGPGKVTLSVAMRYRIVDNVGAATKKWKVSTVGWIYTLKDGGGALIADYHWHPEITPDIAFPHLHAPDDASRRHLPTGRVLIEDVLSLAVESGAQARDPAKWERVRELNVANFAKGATWGTRRGE